MASFMRRRLFTKINVFDQWEHPDLAGDVMQHAVYVPCYFSKTQNSSEFQIKSGPKGFRKEIEALCFSPQWPLLLRMTVFWCLVLTPEHGHFQIHWEACIFPKFLQETVQPVDKTCQEQLLEGFPLIRY